MNMVGHHTLLRFFIRAEARLLKPGTSIISCNFVSYFFVMADRLSKAPNEASWQMNFVYVVLNSEMIDFVTLAFRWTEASLSC